MRRLIAGLFVVVGLALTQVVHAAGLSFKVTDGAEAKFLEKRINHMVFDTSLWFDSDTVLLLTYGSKDFLLNVDGRSGTIACRLGI